MKNLFYASSVLFLYPVTLIIVGKLFLAKAPKDINDLFGYRTKRSSKNQETWDFAHKYFGEIAFKLGIFLFIATIPLLIFFKSEENFNNILMVISHTQLVIFLSPIFFTERALKKNFDKNGFKINNE